MRGGGPHKGFEQAEEGAEGTLEGGLPGKGWEAGKQAGWPRCYLLSKLPALSGPAGVRPRALPKAIPLLPSSA